MQVGRTVCSLAFIFSVFLIALLSAPPELSAADCAGLLVKITALASQDSTACDTAKDLAADLEKNGCGEKSHGFNLIAKYFLSLNKRAEVIKYSELSVTADSTNAPSLSLLGFMYFLEDRYADAVTVYAQLFRVDPMRVQDRSGYAQSLRLIGRRQEAEQQESIIEDSFGEFGKEARVLARARKYEEAVSLAKAHLSEARDAKEVRALVSIIFEVERWKADTLLGNREYDAAAAAYSALFPVVARLDEQGREAYEMGLNQRIHWATERKKMTEYSKEVWSPRYQKH
jgi:tetratricopeptide (TPR) repeat protein